jgi:hypothetical protein
MCDNKGCAKFFEEYDDVFLPSLAKPAIEAAIDAILPLLLKRQEARLDGKPLPVPADAAAKAAVKLLSDEQIKLFTKHFTTKQGKLDQDCIQTCFVKFANGELRGLARPLPDGKAGEPDGSYFFLFAEFAFLAIEMGHDKASWQDIARTQVKAEEVFNEVYLPAPGVNKGLTRDYRFKGKPVAEKKKKELHDAYQKLKPAEVESKHKDNLKIARDAADVALAPPGTRRLDVMLADVRVNSRIGRDWRFDISVDGATTTMETRLTTRAAPYVFDAAPLLARDLPPDAPLPAALPVAIGITEHDPKYDDTGSAVGTLTVTGTAGDATIRGIVQGVGGDPRTAELIFRFAWRVTPVDAVELGAAPALVGEAE